MIIPHWLLFYINMAIMLYEIIWFNLIAIVNVNIISGAAEVFFKLNSIMKSFCYASDNYAKVRVFHLTFSVTYNWVVLDSLYPPLVDLLRTWGGGAGKFGRCDDLIKCIPWTLIYYNYNYCKFTLELNSRFLGNSNLWKKKLLNECNEIFFPLWFLGELLATFTELPQKC